MRRRRHLVGPAAVVAVMVATVALGTASPWTEPARADRVLERAAPVTVPATTTTVAPTTTTTAAPTTTTTVPPTTTTAAPAPAPRFTMEPYKGLGAWVDVYDWSSTFAMGSPAAEPDAMDQLAAQGVQTLFIQASKWDAPDDVVDLPRLLAWVDRAHQHGISVVAWYLPTLEDPNRDMQRLMAIAALPVEGLAIDIESRKVADPVERSRRLVQVSSALRAALPGEVLGAIPLEPVLMEEVNPGFWPGFPWAEIAPSYDVWLPMSYWTNRRPGTPWRDVRTYVVTNIDRVRNHIGRPDAPIHVLGGIGDQTTPQDLVAFRAAAAERGAIGGSIYDFRTTSAAHWPELLPFRDLRP